MWFIWKLKVDSWKWSQHCVLASPRRLSQAFACVLAWLQLPLLSWGTDRYQSGSEQFACVRVAGCLWFQSLWLRHPEAQCKPARSFLCDLIPALYWGAALGVMASGRGSLSLPALRCPQPSPAQLRHGQESWLTRAAGLENPALKTNEGKSLSMG